MSNGGGDGTNGGRRNIMAEIVALVAPPRRLPPPETRRGGRVALVERCDSCQEGGDLLCCDSCSAAFHLICHEPPLTEHDVPFGEWLCHRCRVSRASQTRPATRSTGGTIQLEDSPVINIIPQDGDIHPLTLLGQQVANGNPTEFALPPNLASYRPFPGDWLDGAVEVRAGASCYACALPYSDERVLISCNFCPLHFHLDCLNPPRTAPPRATRWMCPNHPEHALDAFIVQSESYTERARVWREDARVISQLAVQLRFCTRAGRSAPPFQRKVRVPPVARRARVPAYVKSLYKSGVRSPLLDDDEVERLASTVPPKPVSPSPDNRLTYSRRSLLLREMRSKLAGKEDSSADLAAPLRRIQVSRTNNLLGRLKAKISPTDEVEPSDEPCPQPLKRQKPHYESTVSLAPGDQSTPVSPHARLGADQELATSTNGHSDATAWQLEVPDVGRTQLDRGQISNQVPRDHLVNGHLSSRHLLAEATVPSSTHISFATFVGLAEEVLGARGKGSKEANGIKPLLKWSPKETHLNPTISNPQAVAVLVPVTGHSRSPLSLRSSSATVGAGASSEINLRLAAPSCRRVSLKHAVIFIDKNTKQFELLNYSVFGVEVDGVSYGVDLRDVEEDSLVAEVRQLVSQPTLTEETSCVCESRPSSSGNWLGAIPLHHGSVLQFGCAKFVFSAMEQYHLDEAIAGASGLENA